MPRKARVLSASNIYHVVIRGADRQILFEEISDFKKYLDLLEYYKNECHFDIFAYCLMSNHIHLLIYTPTTSLETIFRRMNTHYAMWFNMKYDRTGFLQQGRYYSEPVEDISYLLNVVRYIHQNPYNAGLEPYPGASYPWSSIHSYLDETPSFINIKYIYNLLGEKDNFLAFHNEIVEIDCLDIHKLKKRLPDDVAKQIILEETGCSTVKDFQVLSLSDRKKYLLRLHEKGISIRQLNRLTGVSKGIISRAVTEGRSS